MELHFTYAIEDWREALEDPKRRKARTGWRGSSWVRWGSWIFLALIAAGWLIIFLIIRRLPLAASVMPAAPPEPPQDLWLAMIPMLLPASVALMAVISHLMRLIAQRWPDRKLSSRNARLISQLKRWVGTIAMWVVIFLIVAPPAPTQWRAPRSIVMLVAIVPWASVFLVHMMLIKLRKIDPVEDLWEKMPSLQRTRTVRLGDDGFVMQEELLTQFFNWQYFSSARETPHTLIIKGERNAVIPKRAFASQSDLETARSIIQNRVSNCTFLVEPGGFPVLLDG
jgi:hypothetical protein